MKKSSLSRKISVFAFIAVIAFSGCIAKNDSSQSDLAIAKVNIPKIERSDDFKNEYTLEKVVVLSRHNIRSPISDGTSTLAKITPHKWFNWTSKASELSLRGGVLETIMGQYFRKWLESENLIPENYIPKDGEVRFYSNSMQRTIATSQYFSSGMLPVANVLIEHRFAPSKMDDVFTPQVLRISDDFTTQALSQINNMQKINSLSELGSKLLDAYAILEKVLDFADSEYAKSNNLSHFKTDDTEISFVENAEPKMRGSLKLATSASDALVLQYFEEPNDKKAAFGHKMSEEDWEKISSIKDLYGDLLFTAPIVAKQAAGPLILEISKELTEPNRKFTFLCGHDSNVGSVLAAIGTKDYSLPCTIEKKTPIGVKFVIEVWKNKNDQKFASLSLVYQTTVQLRSCQMLSLDNPPAKYALTLNTLSANEDGLYLLAELLALFENAAAPL